MEDINPPKRPISLSGAKSNKPSDRANSVLHMDGSCLRSAFDDGNYEKPYVVRSMWQMKSPHVPASPVAPPATAPNPEIHSPAEGAQCRSDLPEEVKFDTERNNARRTYVDGPPPPHPASRMSFVSPDTDTWHAE